VALVVQKFGGSSVASAERIRNAARRAILAQQKGNQVIVVVSARGDTTDDLIDLANEISDHPPAREMDMLLATGEQISIALLAMAIHELDYQALSFTGAQAGIRTDRTHTKARIRTIDTTRLRHALDAGNIVIVAGFQGSDDTDNITTLGRGGSDTTAVALAAALKHGPNPLAVGCEIYTDVEGIYTTDPRIVKEARKLDAICYDEMLELASVGAGVMNSRSIEFAKKFDVPLQVRSSLAEAEGTWIIPESKSMQADPVRGAAIVLSEARVAVIDVPDQVGVSRDIFAALADKNIVVDMIAQNIGANGKASIGFTVPGPEIIATLKAIKPWLAKKKKSLDKDWLNARLSHEVDVSKISVVGVGMRDRKGVAAQMFGALAKAQVNMKMITTSDIKISVLVDREDAEKALHAVHSAFELDRPKTDSRLPLAGTISAVAESHPTTSDAAAAVPEAGVWRRVENMEAWMTHMENEDRVVSEVKLDQGQSRLTIRNLPDRPGTCSEIFKAVAEADISVDMILQNPSEQDKAQISFSVSRKDEPKARAVTAAVLQSIDLTSTVDSDIMDQVIVKGIGMRTHTGFARRMFQALADFKINIKMINTSEVHVSVVVEHDVGNKAVDALKSAFNL
jgi:aspartate kinase